MATHEALGAVGASLERLLSDAFTAEAPYPSTPATKAALVRSEDLKAGTASEVIGASAITIFLHRVEVNHTMRAAWSGVGAADGRSHLPLDLHFLLTAWAGNAQWEHRILGRAMQAIEDTPVLAGPLLDPSADWAPGEAVQLLPADLGEDTIMRIFDSLGVPMRLSVAYLARVTRVDGRRVERDPLTVEVLTGATPSAAP